MGLGFRLGFVGVPEGLIRVRVRVRVRVGVGVRVQVRGSVGLPEGLVLAALDAVTVSGHLVTVSGHL